MLLERLFKLLATSIQSVLVLSFKSPYLLTLSADKEKARGIKVRRHAEITFRLYVTGSFTCRPAGWSVARVECYSPLFQVSPNTVQSKKKKKVPQKD